VGILGIRKIYCRLSCVLNGRGRKKLSGTNKHTEDILGKWKEKSSQIMNDDCAAGFALLNLPKGKSLGRSKPETNSSNEQAH